MALVVDPPKRNPKYVFSSGFFPPPHVRAPFREKKAKKEQVPVSEKGVGSGVPPSAGAAVVKFYRQKFMAVCTLLRRCARSSSRSLSTTGSMWSSDVIAEL